MKTKRLKSVSPVNPVKKEKWETVIDFTKYRKGGIPVDELIQILTSLNTENSRKRANSNYCLD